MAAYKAGCKTVIIPNDNVKDLAEISEEVKNAVNFISVSNFDEVMKNALEYMPSAKEIKEEKTKQKPIINKNTKEKREIVTQ